MKWIAFGLLIGSLVLGAVALPAEAGGWHHWHHHHHHGHGHFFGGFFAGAGTVLILDALVTPRVIYYEPRYYHRGPICRDVLIPERWELRSHTQNGFTTYYHVWVPGTWQRECY